MNWLLIEDDANKEKQLNDFFHEYNPDTSVTVKKSYQSGLKEIFLNKYDLIVLDMSLPTFDIQNGEDGYVFRHLAGKDILGEMQRKKISTKVIVVTQFDYFGEGKEHISLEILKENMRKNYSNYVGTVYYNPSLDNWKKELTTFILNSFN